MNFENKRLASFENIPQMNITIKGYTNTLQQWLTYLADLPNSNEIFYRSDGQIQLFSDEITFGGGVIIGDTYSGGKGVITTFHNATIIDDNAFYDCYNLYSIIIPNTVTSIGDYAFSECSELNKITIPNSVTSIGDWAFDSCSSLTGISIPDSVTSIGAYAFYNCGSLSNVICNPTTPPTLGTQVFDINASGRKIKVPSGSVDAYKSATNWSNYASDIISQ